MNSEMRQEVIEDYLQKVEFASLEELSRRVAVSSSTVRRDLLMLESRGAVRRTHGGARIVVPRSDEFTFSARTNEQRLAKEAIGRACAELIQPGLTLILDAGTTVYHVACCIESKSPYIITNSLPVAGLFASANRLEVVVSGGVIYPRLGVLVGPMALEAFATIHADVAIMSAHGLTLEGVTNSHGLLIDIQRAMIQAAHKVIFCLDHTKLGRQSVLPLVGLESVDTIVTDSGAPPELVASLRAKGVEVIVAPEDGGHPPANGRNGLGASHGRNGQG